MPGSSPVDLIHTALQDLTSAIRTYSTHPLRDSTGSPVLLDETLVAGLRDASNFLSDIRLPARSSPSETGTPKQRVSFDLSPRTADFQRVPSSNIDPLPSVPGAPSLAPTLAPPFSSLQRNRRKSPPPVARGPTYRQAHQKDVPANSKSYFSHIGRRWRDTDTGEIFKIHTVVLPANASGPGSATCHFQCYDLAKFPKPPGNVDDFEYTPCSEILNKHSTYVEFIVPARVSSAAALIAATIDGPAPSLGTLHMANALSQPQHCPSPPTRWQNGKRVIAHDLSARCAAAAASANDKSRLNLNADGTPLSYRGTFKLPNASAWRLLDGDEIARLINSGTISAIHRSVIPADRKMDVTYYNPKPKEKYNPDTDVITGRIRGTIGGDRVNYPGATTTSTADLITVKVLLHSVVSDRRRGLDAKFCCLDLIDFYLGTPMDRPEYLAVDIKFIPAATRLEYGLDEFIDNNRILFRVDKCMYGLPQSGYLSNKHLVGHLATAGYLEDANVPCLFTHNVSGLQFSLIVDDFGIKYYSMADLQHLVATIEAGGWKHKLDMTGSKYIGVTLAWDYVNNLVDLSMPSYVAKGLTRFSGNKPLKPASSPGIYLAPVMGVKIQPEKTDDSAPATPAQKLWIQQVNGYFLYYARILDELILPTCNEISSSQANPTQRTVAAVWRLLRYLSSHQSHVVRFVGCDMVLVVDSDASHNSRAESISVAGGYHRLVNRDGVIKGNGTLLAISCQIPTVCQGASESEYAALYINGSAAAWIRTNLAAMNYPQSATVITTDNLCAQGIANKTLTARKSKAIAMRYHWIRDRVRLGEFIVQWRPGSENRADFFTKHLPIHKFVECAKFYSATSAA